MHPDTPRMTLHGFRQMTAVMSYCAGQSTHVGGGVKL